MYEEYISVLKQRLDDYRFVHSLAVAKQAKLIAENYGFDADKAYLAGLLHDITKNDTKEMHFKLFNENNIFLDEVEKQSSKLWHAISGAAFIKTQLKIDDNEILSAVRYHTTGRKDMTLLEKIVYIADFTSEDRKYPDVDCVRKLLTESLEKAILYAIKHTISDLAKKNMPIHSDTFDAYNFLIVQGGITLGNVTNS